LVAQPGVNSLAPPISLAATPPRAFNLFMRPTKFPLAAILLAMLCLPALTGCDTMTKTKSIGKTTDEFLEAKTYRRKLPADARMDYLLFLPADYRGNSTNRWPLIFFLHGSGERGTNVWKTATHGPSKYIKSHPDFPFIFVSPQCANREYWDREPLIELLDDVTAKYRVDTNRIYLTGLSMGGFGAWELATAYPERFAAVAPICGGGRFISVLLTGYDGRLKALQSLPVWAFHGAKDPVVPLAESERMVEMMKAAGCKEVEFTVYPGAQHDSWTETYSNPKLYEWFLEHRRKPGK
jgi:predicted peptidase